MYIVKYIKLIHTCTMLYLIGGCQSINEDFTRNSSFDSRSAIVAVFSINNDESAYNHVLLETRMLNKTGVLEPSNGYDGWPAQIKKDKDYFFAALTKPLGKDEYNIISLIGHDAGFDSYVLNGYDRCGEVFAFHVSEPGVYYLGDISIKENEGSVSYKINSNLSKVKSFVTHNYPNIPTGEIKHLPFEVLQQKNVCVARTIILPI